MTDKELLNAFEERLFNDEEVEFLRAGIIQITTQIAIESFLGNVLLSGYSNRLKDKIEKYKKAFKEVSGISCENIFTYELKDGRPEVTFLELGEEVETKKLIYLIPDKQIKEILSPNENKRWHDKIDENISSDMILYFDMACDHSEKVSHLLDMFQQKLYPTVVDQFDPDKTYFSTYLLLLLPERWREDWTDEKAFPSLCQKEDLAEINNTILAQIRGLNAEDYRLMQKAVLIDSGVVSEQDLIFIQELYSKNENNLIEF